MSNSRQCGAFPGCARKESGSIKPARTQRAAGCAHGEVQTASAGWHALVYSVNSFMNGSGESQAPQRRLEALERQLIDAEAVKRELERKLGELQNAREADAQHLNDLQKAFEQFGYSVSHELQEALRMVSAYTQLLGRRCAGRLDAEADEFIRYAVDGAKRMSAMIADLLVFSRISTRGGPMARADSGETLARVLAGFEAEIKLCQAEISHDAMPWVVADGPQLTLLFQNLLSNALKFRSDAPQKIHVGALREGARWRFSVRDNGQGIAPQYFEKVFQIFQRLQSHDESPGTGMGLAICKQIVERHGGRIWVESGPGHGSTFFFTLAATGESG